MAGSGGRSGLLYGLGAALCAAVAGLVWVWLVPQAGVGDIDPVSAVVALAALAATLWSARRSVRALQSTHPDAAEVVERLAIEVRDREEQARLQLLGGRSRTIDVDFDFRSAPTHDARHAEPVGSLHEVVAYYQALHPRRLVITGAPGAGKTVLALDLILGLLVARGPGDAVPVKMSAAAWDTERPLRRWLVEHLVEAYRLSRPSAKALLDAGLVLPVIDGLDEMDAGQQPGYASRASRAVRALNAYQHGRDAAPLVLTCRSRQYQALNAAQVWTHDAARIEIRAIDSAKAAQFIQSRVDDATRWQPVLNTITNHPGGTLAVALSTPWRLTLATTVYEQRTPETGAYLRDPGSLIKLSAASPETMRDHLLEHFISAAIAAHTAAERPYPDHHVHQWLRVLATYLDDNVMADRTLGGVPLSGTDLVLHQLWPLAGINRVRNTVLAAFALIWLIAAAILLVQAGIGFNFHQLTGAALPLVAIAYIAHMSQSELWPTPAHINIRKLRTKNGRRQFARGLAAGLMVRLAIGLTVGIIAALAVGLTVGLTAGLTVGLTAGLVIWLAVGLAIGLTDDATATPWNPTEIVKHDLAAGLTVGLAAGLTVGLAAALAVGLTVGLTAGLTVGLAGGLTISLQLGLAGTRYVAFLLCTRRRFTTQPLPWRLGQFLDWCCQAGLVRHAGTGYQFRHRELQHYLAHSKPHRSAMISPQSGNGQSP